MSIHARLFEGTDCRGRSAFANLIFEATPDTYLQLPWSWLVSNNLGAVTVPGLSRGISSLEVGASSWERGGFVILFAGPQYTSRYASFPVTPGSTVCIPNLWSEGFDNRTMSALIVRQSRFELHIVVGDLGTPALGTLREQIDDVVFSIPLLHRRLDPRTREPMSPIISWAMWPHFAASRKYVFINIPVRVEIPGWADYSTAIHFWIYLFINSSGKLRGFVDWYGVWVESGLLSGTVADEFMSRIGASDILGAINSRIFAAVSTLDALTFKKLYYLPGRAGHTGHVDDDVSLVLVKAV